MSTATLPEPVQAPESDAPAPVTAPELDVSQLERENGARVLRAIARNCVAVKVSCHGIGYERKIADADVSVEGQSVPDKYLSGARWRLIPAEIYGAISAIAASARRQPSLFGTPFPGGAYLVPVNGPNGRNPAAELFGVIRASRESYHGKAVELRPKWEQHVEATRTELPAMYEKVRRWLVDGETFVARHTISMMLMPLGAGVPADFDARFREAVSTLALNPDVASADLDAVRRLLPSLTALAQECANAPAAVLGEDASAAWVQEANAATSRAVAEAVQTMIQQPLTEFAESLANMEGIIERGSNVRTGTIDQIRRAYDKLAGFSFLATPELRRRLQAVADRLNGISPQRVNGQLNRTSARELASFFREVREEMVAEDTHVAAYGQFMRGLDL